MRFTRILSYGVGLGAFFKFSPEMEKRYSVHFESIPPLAFIMSCRRFIDAFDLLMICGTDLSTWNNLWNYGEKYEFIRPFIGWNEDWDAYTRPAHERVADRLLRFCIRNGGLSVKIGQSISSIPTLPAPYGEKLKVLFDHNPYMPFESIRAVIESDLGAPLSHLFSEFETTPIGSASLAQVHRARLQDGTPVAVKVEYPYINLFQNIDIFSSTVCMDVVYYFLNKVDSPSKYGFDTKSPSYKEVVDKFKKEIDLELELQNLRRARDNFKKWDSVYIPKAYKDLSSKRVLTMEYIDDACIATDVKQMEAWGFSAKQCTKIMLEAFAKQQFEDGFLHADPHRSNIFVRRNPNNPSKPQIVILDHGLYVEIEPTFRKRFARYYESLALGDSNYLKEFLRMYNINDRYYRIFATIILMDIYDDRNNPQEHDATGKRLQARLMKEFHGGKMSNERREKMVKAQQELSQAFTEGLPPSFRFILRNSFLLNSINAANGSPCNRLVINARYAAKTIHTIEEDQAASASMAKRFYRNLRSFLRKIYFEYRLLLLRLQSYIFAILLRFRPIRSMLIKQQMETMPVVKEVIGTKSKPEMP